MHCYNHHSVPAVAICKNCNKGLCPECLTEVENGIACTATCVDEVKKINELVKKSSRAGSRIASSYYRNAFIYFALALLFYYSAFEYSDLKMYGAIAGTVFAIGGFLSINTARKYKKTM